MYIGNFHTDLRFFSTGGPGHGYPAASRTRIISLKGVFQLILIAEIGWSIISALSLKLMFINSWSAFTLPLSCVDRTPDLTHHRRLVDPLCLP